MLHEKPIPLHSSQDIHGLPHMQVHLDAEELHAQEEHVMFVKLLAPGIHRNSALRARDGEGASATQPSVTMRVPTIDDITAHTVLESVTQVFGGYGIQRLVRTYER